MNNNLFDKIPENFFSVLSRKYKSVYALALLTLYETYKVSIKKTDYLNMLTSRISDSMSLFSVALDRLDDKDDEKIESAADVNEELTPSKISYIVKKLEKMTGKTVCADFSCDSGIIGGLVVRFENSQLDLSVKSRLEDMKKHIFYRA